MGVSFTGQRVLELPRRPFGHARARLQSYTLPMSLRARVFWAAMRGRQRDLWADSHILINSLEVAPQIRHAERLPFRGPVVFLPNHYERKDAVWVGWGAIALTHALTRYRNRRAFRKLHWVITDTWADAYIGPIHIPPRMLGWAINGLASVYELITMPAWDLPDHDDRRAESAAAIRKVCHALASGESVAVHPEAGGFETMIPCKPGAGRLIKLLARRGYPLIPIGVFEEGDQLIVQIGEQIPPDRLLHLSDDQAAEATMLEIAALVPPRIRGVYATPEPVETARSAD